MNEKRLYNVDVAFGVVRTRKQWSDVKVKANYFHVVENSILTEEVDHTAGEYYEFTNCGELGANWKGKVFYLFIFRKLINFWVLFVGLFSGQILFSEQKPTINEWITHSRFWIHQGTNAPKSGS